MKVITITFFLIIQTISLAKPLLPDPVTSVSWHSIFFESIDRKTVLSGLIPLKVKELNTLESEIRIWVVYKKRMLFCIFSCTNSVRQFILSAWLLKLLIVGTVEVKISLNLARRPTINSATAAMIVVNKAAKTPQ